MPRLLTIAAFCTVLGASIEVAAVKRPLAKVEETRDVWATDDAGRFRVAFPLHNRLFVDAGTHQLVVDDAHTAGGSYGFAWDFAFDADFPDEEIWWQLRHTAVAVRWEPSSPAGWDLRVSLLEADYLRHDTSSYILIPARRDIRLPAPFDVAIAWKLGGGRFRLDAAEPSVIGWDVGEFRVMADFIRDPRYRHRLAVGAASRYRLSPTGDAWTHDLVPLSGGAFLYGWENRRGTFEARLEGGAEYGAELVVGGDPIWSWSSRARLAVEWTPLAVNDLPVSVYVEANWERAFAQTPIDEWGGRAGVRLALPLGL